MIIWNISYNNLFVISLFPDVLYIILNYLTILVRHCKEADQFVFIIIILG